MDLHRGGWLYCWSHSLGARSTFCPTPCALDLLFVPLPGRSIFCWFAGLSLSSYFSVVGLLFYLFPGSHDFLVLLVNLSFFLLLFSGIAPCMKHIFRLLFVFFSWWVSYFSPLVFLCSDFLDIIFDRGQKKTRRGVSARIRGLLFRRVRLECRKLI